MANKIADLLVSLGINTKNFDSGIKGATKKTAGFQKALKGGIAVAGVAVAAALTIATKEAVAYEKTLGNLVSSLKNIKGASADTFRAFVAESNRLQDLTGIADDKILAGMRQFVDITGDANAALTNAAIVADFATKNNMDLEASARILGLAYNGETQMLKRYGITLDETVRGQEALNAVGARFQGAAEGQLNTVLGQWQDFKNIISDIAKSFGVYLLPLISDGLNFLRNAFKTFRDSGAVQWIGREMMYQARVIIPAYIKALNPKNALKGGIITTFKKEWDSLHAEFYKQIADVEAVDVVWDKYTENINTNTKALVANEKEEQEWTKRLAEAKDQALEFSGIAGNIMSNTVSSILDSTKTMSEKMSDILKTGLSAILDIIGIQIKAQIAGLVATNAAAFGAATPQLLAASAQLAVLEGLKAAVGTISLADGGIVSAPTRAIVGDSSSPEVVAPLHKLQPMISKAVNNSMNNKIVINIKSNGLDNAADVVRKQIAPELDRYFKKRGGGFYGA